MLVTAAVLLLVVFVGANKFVCITPVASLMTLILERLASGHCRGWAAGDAATAAAPGNSLRLLTRVLLQ